MKGPDTMYNINKHEDIIPLQNGKLPTELSEIFRQISSNILCGEVTPITCYKKEINETEILFRIECRYYIDSDNRGSCVFKIKKKNKEYKLVDYKEVKDVE